MPYEAPYSGSKAALAAIAESARAELEPRGDHLHGGLPGLRGHADVPRQRLQEADPASQSHRLRLRAGISYPIAPRDAAERIYMATLRRRESLALPGPRARQAAPGEAPAGAPARPADPARHGPARMDPESRPIACTTSLAAAPPRFRDTTCAMATISGVITAMVTPFAEDGALDLDAARRLARHLVENGSHGLVVAGTTGESPTLSDDEKLRLLEAVKDEVGDRATVICGTGSNDTRHSVELTAGRRRRRRRRGAGRHPVLQQAQPGRPAGSLRGGRRGRRRRPRSSSTTSPRAA